MQDGNMNLVIVTGLSGAGKSQAVRSLEDLGYYCVDNLPPALVPGFLEIITASGENDKVALVMDVRGGEFFSGISGALGYLNEKGYNYQVLFLEAMDEILIRRYKETRRKHPFDEEGRVVEGIVKERKIFEELRGIASKIIDTSDMSTSELRKQIREIFGGADNTMVITVVSFGFKYGIPLDSDLVFDVRFLPNPFYEENLKELTGHEKDVQDFIYKGSDTREFLKKIRDFIEFLVPNYYKEGKSHLVIAIGCTGGRHRSVFMALRIHELLENLKSNYRVILKHRDVHR